MPNPPYGSPARVLAPPTLIPNLLGSVPALALFVFTGYFLGARLGLALTFPPLVLSVLWPPNAVLFAAMMLVPARRWWIVAAAALPAHLVAELQDGIPLLMAMSWFASNVTEALIGAGAVRLLAGSSNPFETPRGVAMFGIAAVVSAMLSSFLDSAFVLANRWGTTGYWELWYTRLLSNITADWVVVPPIFTGALMLSDLKRGRRARRGPGVDETALFFVALAAVTVAVFNTELAWHTPSAQLCLPFPLLLWAAFRLGPAGASASFALVAVLTIWGAGHGIGAFAAQQPLANAHSVQLYLLCIGPTLLCIAAVVAERGRAVESLRLSDKRFQFVLRATRDIVYERDLETDGLWWSQDGPSHYGYSRRRDLRTFASFANIIHPEDRARVVELHEATLRDGKPLWEAEFRIRRSNGAYSAVHEQGFVARDSAGRAVQMVGALTDVTERHDAEELSQRLAHASRLTAMGELTASIAHEINQPMSAILTNVDSAEVLLDSGRPDLAELRAVIADIRSDDLRASEIIRHIRNLANKHEVEIAPFDMNQLVESSLRLAQPGARLRGVQLRSRCGRIPLARGDRIHAQQVLLNLMFNGMDAMAETPRGARTLLVTTALDPAGMIEIAVRDNGHGIAPEHTDRIFESFFTTKKDGMGLGLSIARSLIAAQGGRLSAANNADSGATVSFTLPVEPGRAAPA